MIKGSVPKWVWLYSNLSSDPKLIDALFDLNSDIISHDYATTRGRLDK